MAKSRDVRRIEQLLQAQTHKIKWIIQAKTPVDSGMLQRDVVCAMVGDGHLQCTVGGSTYYMPYTEEKWINRPGTNPNEGWFASVVDEVATHLTNELGGDLTRPE